MPITKEDREEYAELLDEEQIAHYTEHPYKGKEEEITRLKEADSDENLYEIYLRAYVQTRTGNKINTISTTNATYVASVLGVLHGNRGIEFWGRVKLIKVINKKLRK